MEGYDQGRLGAVMRRLAVGDVRGELGLLKKLIDKIGPTESDSLIFLGSYLGPGPNSRGVLDYLIALKQKFPNISFLRGCYEWLFGFCIETEPHWIYQKLWGDMGGFKVFQSYVDNRKLMVLNGKKPSQVQVPLRIPATHIEFLSKDLWQWYEDDIFPYVLCHSGGHPALFVGKLEDEAQTVFAEKGWWTQDWRRIDRKTVVFSH